MISDYSNAGKFAYYDYGRNIMIVADNYDQIVLMMFAVDYVGVFKYNSLYDGEWRDYGYRNHNGTIDLYEG